MGDSKSILDQAAAYGRVFREKTRPLHPTASAVELRQAFCVPLPDEGSAPEDVINDLIAAAEPGLVGNTAPGFYAWVMGGSAPVGVAADWLTSVWGQNAGIYQTSPAAAIAEECVSGWLLELLDLPRESSVGFVTGATMATFVGLAAARSEVLARAGYDFEALGLQGVPKIHVFFSDDVHVANLTALRHIGLGESNFVRIASNAEGLMDVGVLTTEMSSHEGPKIVIAQAGHINSGGFDDMATISALCRKHDAWMHVDGAFGLWARALPEKSDLAQGTDLADSWSVDGHKWLQIPYDSGFAIVRDSNAHRRAMDTTAGYLNQAPEDGRSPTEFVPGLSRRARGFAAWAVLRSFGRVGVQEIVRRHCLAAQRLAGQLSDVDGLKVANVVHLNQVVIEPDGAAGDEDRLMALLAERVNQSQNVFLKTAQWKNRTVLRVSVISTDTDVRHIDDLARLIRTAWAEVSGLPSMA